MNPKIRAAIYAAIVGAIGVLMALGLISSDQEAVLLGFADSALDLVAAAALILAARKVTPDTWSDLRLGAYSTAAAAFILLGTFGLIAPDATDPWLNAVDSVLNLIGMGLLGVATAKTPDPVPRRAVT